MTDSRASIRRRHATTAVAAALVMALGGAVTSCGTKDSERTDKPSQRAKLAFKDALHTHYLRVFDKSEREQIADSSEPFYANLEASGLSPDTGPVTARNVKVTVELSAAKAVRFDTAKGQQGCERSGDVITCTPKNIASGDSANLWLFSMAQRESAPEGPAGSMKITVTSANAPAIHHTTQLVIGAPELAARSEEGFSDVTPGSELKVRPAFGNRGHSGLDDALSVVLDVKGQATLRRQYSNCRYDKADAPTKAVCAFPGPLPAGAAYETDRPFTAAVAETGRQGLITYTVYPAPNTPADAQLPDSAPRGSGAPLGLRPVDGSLFTTYGRESAHGGVRFLTARTQDRQVNGFTLKGQVGQTNDISVMDVNGYFEGDTYLTLPEGVSLGWHPSGEGHETLYCGYVDQKNRKVLCPAPLTDPAILRFRIDKRVEGAQGTISVKPDPEHPDPDLTNNTAPITMEYVD
ncbi:hypothetical protein MOV08_24910 [Streptomyces yunnanensis]|uniref:Secreted protein n=1 Tax=Streptomyces yunnanensis TaxID=156453 RepID=A0ABY8AB36_9ACTN|nr:hypothetical protein [Streptomyces yunnanensis]WEB42173.1 hypothetical protein MOV08_24910 [Streptomyces yunnanensis]